MWQKLVLSFILRLLLLFKHLKTFSWQIDFLSYQMDRCPHAHKVSMEDVSVRSQSWDTLCVWCRVTCLGLLSQDRKYGKAVFPLPQQRKSLDRTYVLFCTSRTQHVAEGHVISLHNMFLWPFMSLSHSVVFQDRLLWITWTSDVIHRVDLVCGGVA